MFVYFISSILIDLNNYIDGLENVQWTFNQKNQEVEIKIIKERTYFYFQDLKNTKVSFSNDQKEVSLMKNGVLLPIESGMKITANWTKYKDYLFGFFDANNCDNIIYTTFEKDWHPLSLYFDKNVCIYHLNKQSVIQIKDKTYSKIARIKGTNDFVKITTLQIEKSIFKKEKIIQNLNKKTILNDDDDDYDDPGFTNNPNKLMYALGWISLVIGILFFYVIGLCGTNCCYDRKCCVKCCCGKNCCLGEERFLACVIDKKNDFYEKTMPEFDAYNK